MKYFGLQSQIRKNNSNSVLLLIMFPLVFFGLTWLFFAITMMAFPQEPVSITEVNRAFLRTIPWITLGVIIWFTIAWFSHTSIIDRATDSKPLERSENKRVY